MPMVGMAIAPVISRAKSSATPSTTTAKAPASAVALASCSTRSRSPSLRPLALNGPSIRAAWGRSPTCPITGMPRWVR